MIRGETQYNSVSRFVREIPDDLMDNPLPKPRKMEEGVFSEVFGFAPDKGAGQPGASRPYDFRPKAILRPTVTPKADKPFIARGIGSLNQIAGISKGGPAIVSGELEYSVGERVRHVKYGEGTVLQIDREPRDYKVAVEFDAAGKKIMYASFAKLKRV